MVLQAGLDTIHPWMWCEGGKDNDIHRSIATTACLTSSVSVQDVHPQQLNRGYWTSGILDRDRDRDRDPSTRKLIQQVDRTMLQIHRSFGLWGHCPGSCSSGSDPAFHSHSQHRHQSSKRKEYSTPQRTTTNSYDSPQEYLLDNGHAKEALGQY